MDVKPKLLLVDDERRFVGSLQGILTHYDYDCTPAFNGSEAIKCLKRERFDVALLDVGLPDVSGCAIAEFIKSSCQNTTVVMLTGQNNVETAVAAMKNGAYDFLSKPIDHDVLIKTLDNALERNSLKEELRVSEKRFRTLSEVAWEGIVIHDKGTLLEANKQFYRMFGYSEGELENEGFLLRILTSEALVITGAKFAGREAESAEMIGVRKDGSTFNLQVKSCIIEYFGRPARVMIMRDISDRVRHEREKLNLQKKLAKASKLNALGLMAGSVAHDLNNILTAVVSYPDLLLRQMAETDRYYDEIKKIQQAGKQAASIVSDLVSIARGGVRKKVVADLNKIVIDHFESIEHSERLLNYPDVFVQTSLQQDLRRIECSPQHIAKLLMNLVGNALESVGEEGMVQVKTTNCKIFETVSSELFTLEPGNYVKLVVNDNGPGIDKNELDNIFDPFYTTKTKGKSGTGLGLSIVWNVVKEHGGAINVKNLHPGASFEIYLPITEKPLTGSRPGIVSEALMGNGEKILLVDDRPEQNAVIAKMLDLLGYTSESFTSGEEVLAYLEKNSADLVLLDMIMEDGLNGRQTYEKILKIHPDLKAVIISGYSESDEIERAKRLGVSTFLEKPVTLPMIGKAVSATLLEKHRITEE